MFFIRAFYVTSVLHRVHSTHKTTMKNEIVVIGLFHIVSITLDIAEPCATQNRNVSENHFEQAVIGYIKKFCNNIF